MGVLRWYFYCFGCGFAVCLLIFEVFGRIEVGKCVLGLVCIPVTLKVIFDVSLNVKFTLHAI